VWPADRYGQLNPRVTESGGYFAFFTPPGKYYLQVDPGNGFQSWRSPSVTVVNTIVHVNVPLTPVPSGSGTPVTLSSDGPGPLVTTIPLGSSVEWLSTLNEGATAAELRTSNDDPVLQPRTSNPLDPLTSPLGFDGGMLKPGQAYRRQRSTLGEYAYTDGLGHTGTIKVSPVVAEPAPMVTGILPASGSTLGGTGLTITGTNFVTGATVTLGGVAATVTLVSAAQIVATTGCTRPG
jgi:hypothetical protein